VPSSAIRIIPCGCGGYRVRQFSPTTMLRMAPWATREAEDGRARHRAWLDKPETQAQIRSGQLDLDRGDGDSNCEAASSSIMTRAEAGINIGVG
jgi:hypothetical protein